MELETRLIGASSVRAAAEVDMPLAERWRRNGTLKEAPRLEGSARIIVQHEGDASLLSIPARPAPRLAAGIALLALLAALYAVGTLVDVPALVLFGLGALASFIISFMILLHSGSNRLRFTATSVEVSYGLLPIRRQIAINDIEELLDNGEEIALLGDRGYVLIDQPHEPGDRRYCASSSSGKSRGGRACPRKAYRPCE